LRCDQLNMQRVGCLCPLFLALCTGDQNMMGRGLERCAGCPLKLDPWHNAPSHCMQSTCTAHTNHLTIRPRRVVRVAPLGELCSRSDQQAQLHHIMPHIPLLPIHIISIIIPVAISTDRSTDRLCALDMCNTARIFSQNYSTCVKKVGVPKSWFYWATVCTPLPATLFNLASQNSGVPRISTGLNVFTW